MAYCVKCNEKREMRDAVLETIKDKNALIAKCGGCAGKLFRWVGSNNRNRPKGYAVKRARERRLERRKEKLLDSVPKIRAAYWSEDEEPIEEEKAEVLSGKLIKVKVVRD